MALPCIKKILGTEITIPAGKWLKLSSALKYHDADGLGDIVDIFLRPDQSASSYITYEGIKLIPGKLLRINDGSNTHQNSGEIVRFNEHPYTYAYNNVNFIGGEAGKKDRIYLNVSDHTKKGYDSNSYYIDIKSVTNYKPVISILNSSPAVAKQSATQISSIFSFNDQNGFADITDIYFKDNTASSGSGSLYFDGYKIPDGTALRLNIGGGVQGNNEYMRVDSNLQNLLSRVTYKGGTNSGTDELIANVSDGVNGGDSSTRKTVYVTTQADTPKIPETPKTPETPEIPKPPSDTTPPQVSDVSLSGTEGVDSRKAIRIAFDETVSLNRGKLTFTERTYGTSITIDVGAHGNQISSSSVNGKTVLDIRPTKGWAADTTYEVGVEAGAVVDSSGNSISQVTGAQFSVAIGRPATPTTPVVATLTPTTGSGIVTQGYAMGTGSFSHDPTRFAVDIDTPNWPSAPAIVQSLFDGTVIKVVDYKNNGGELYGNYVDVLFDNGVVGRYAHLLQVDSVGKSPNNGNTITDNVFVTLGQRVARGDPLAYAGKTGSAYGEHLHFEAVSGDDVKVPLIAFSPWFGADDGAASSILASGQLLATDIFGTGTGSNSENSDWSGDILIGGVDGNRIFAGSGDDNVKGLGGADIIEGGKGNDRLEGGEGDDVINGGPGDDFITEGGGSDTIDGGLGTNTVKYTKLQSQYTVTSTGTNSYKIVDNKTGDVDTLTNIHVIEYGQNVNASNRGDTAGAGRSSIIWQNNNNGEVAIWRMDGSVFNGGDYCRLPDGRRLPTTWTMANTGDFNADGRADFVFNDSSTGGVAFWMMSGETFTDGDYARDINGNTLNTAAGNRVAATGDLNNDGRGDLLIHNQQTGQIEAWLMNGVTVTSTITPAANLAAADAAFIGDVDGDGDGDIISRDRGTGGVSISTLQNGAISGVSKVRTASGEILTAGAEWQLAGVGLMDAGLTADLIWRNTVTGDVAFWLMNGSTFTSGDYARTASGIQLTPDISWQIKSIGDYNGDGQSDLLWNRADTGELAVWHMSGTKFAGGDFLRTSGGDTLRSSSEWSIQPI